MNKRDLMKSVAGVGVVAAAGATAMLPAKEVHAQLLELGIAENSVLNRMKETGKLRVGWAPNPPWFNFNIETNQFEGIYYDVMRQLATETEVELEMHETTYANSTIELRKGDFDIFGASLFFTAARALVVNFTNPLWAKGSLALTHVDQADRFQTLADINSPDVTIAADEGGREAEMVARLYPQANLITQAGPTFIAAENVRAKRADLFFADDLGLLVYARQNSSWAHPIDIGNPVDKTPATWAIKYGDQAFWSFLYIWNEKMVSSGFVERRYNAALDELTRK